MRLNALLMCRDHESLRLLAAGMDQLEIEKEVCPSVTDAVELLTQRYYSALVVDFELPAAVQVARLARMAPPRRRPVLFAMIGERTDVALAFQAGANFVLYKPLALAQLVLAGGADQEPRAVPVRHPARRHRREPGDLCGRLFGRARGADRRHRNRRNQLRGRRPPPRSRYELRR